MIRVISMIPRKACLPAGIRLHDPPHMEREAVHKVQRRSAKRSG